LRVAQFTSANADNKAFWSFYFKRWAKAQSIRMTACVLCGFFPGVFLSVYVPLYRCCPLWPHHLGHCYTTLLQPYKAIICPKRKGVIYCFFHRLAPALERVVFLGMCNEQTMALQTYGRELDCRSPSHNIAHSAEGASCSNRVIAALNHPIHLHDVHVYTENQKINKLFGDYAILA
jgi:hypothetical protein